jgi:hypothetical protein
MENYKLTKVVQMVKIPALRLDILKIPNININISINRKIDNYYNAPTMSLDHPCHSQK